MVNLENKPVYNVQTWYEERKQQKKYISLMTEFKQKKKTPKNKRDFENQEDLMKINKVIILDQLIKIG